ncbi:hypothetical protein DFJ74DRAFT_678022 [Hyaloraphidium curvatum]|nr:hypothetical protein DFJ74DRAFT_678022 [Hyaloraphidium curvatum]
MAAAAERGIALERTGGPQPAADPPGGPPRDDVAAGARWGTSSPLPAPPGTPLLPAPDVDISCADDDAAELPAAYACCGVALASLHELCAHFDAAHSASLPPDVPDDPYDHLFEHEHTPSVVLCEEEPPPCPLTVRVSLNPLAANSGETDADMHDADVVAGALDALDALDIAVDGPDDPVPEATTAPSPPPAPQQPSWSIPYDEILSLLGLDRLTAALHLRACDLPAAAPLVPDIARRPASASPPHLPSSAPTAPTPAFRLPAPSSAYPASDSASVSSSEDRLSPPPPGHSPFPSPPTTPTDPPPFFEPPRAPIYGFLQGTDHAGLLRPRGAEGKGRGRGWIG